MRPIPLWLALAALLPTFTPVHAAEGPAPNNRPAPGSNAAAGLLQVLQAHQWSLTAAADSQAQTIATLFPADAPPFLFTLPVLVILTRSFVPLCVFSFGISSTPYDNT